MFLPLVILLLFQPAIITASVEKRWYGVQPLKDNKSKGQFGPWPVVCSGEPEETRAIRYCFADARSEKNLENIVDQAVARWGHAIHNSQLTIVPDNEDAMLCSDPDVRPDALVIRDATKDNDQEWNHGPDCPTDSASTGYDYGSSTRGRHHLDFCHLDPGDVEGTKAQAVVTMMHELGHAMGLQHEHQRRDRDDFLVFHCDNLEGYEEAKKQADVDEQAYFEDDDDIEARMRIVCNDDVVASDYLPAALAFIRAHDHRLKAEEKKWRAHTHSTPFDYDSIMIYNSHAHVPADVDGKDPKNWVIKKKDGRPVWQGGSDRATDAKIAEGDVARIAQLYPKADGSSDDAMKLGQWGAAKGKRLRVKIRGLEMIVGAPRRP